VSRIVEQKPTRRRACALLGALAVLWWAAPAWSQQPPGPDGAGTDYFLTIAARVCDRYVDITANKARNNIQESLRDLGPDTLYQTGELVTPAREQAMQSRCRSLSGFRFTLGGGISSTRVTGSWGSLSVASTPFATNIVTEDSVPDRDGQGFVRPDGSTLQGANTIELSEAEKIKAMAKSLVLQGGTPTDPVLNVPFPQTYAFGALRCSDDNVNGDNVEYARYASLRHIYCFAYYVVPPPTSGTIEITKHVSSPTGANQTFNFTGNVSYTPGHDFQLKVVNGADATQRFFRAASTLDDPTTFWTVAESVPPGWRLTDLVCTTQHGSTIDRDPSRPEQVAIGLIAGDTVRCTYTDALVPPPGRLVLSKLTTNGVGSFPMTVRDASGKVVATTSATTTAPGVPAGADESSIPLDPGSYTISEELPKTPDGHWEQTASGCKAQRDPTRGPHAAELTVKITSAQGQVCQFENRFVPAGSITLLKTTRDTTGTTSFTITPLDDPARQYSKTSTTTAPDRPAVARGDSTRSLPLGRYLIQEHGTASSPDRNWVLVSVSCGSRPRPFAQGQVEIELTPGNPHRACHFVDAPTSISPHPPNPNPNPSPGPQPAPQPPAPQPPAPPQAAAKANLVLTKRALSPSVSFGQIATFVITVRNTGAAMAQDVVVNDVPGPHGQFTSSRPSQGTCDELTPLVCTLGAIAPGASANIRVGVRAIGSPLMINLAVVGSSQLDSTLNDNTASATVRVGRLRALRGRCASARPVAHAAC
jgi:uncharacterized repeat protein (TIGR01451 family)